MKLHEAIDQTGVGRVSLDSAIEDRPARRAEPACLLALLLIGRAPGGSVSAAGAFNPC
jgi:hypothetical protein